VAEPRPRDAGLYGRARASPRERPKSASEEKFLATTIYISDIF